MHFKKVRLICAFVGLAAGAMVGLSQTCEAGSLSSNTRLSMSVERAKVRLPVGVEKLSCSPNPLNGKDQYNYLCLVKFVGRDTPVKWSYVSQDDASGIPFVYATSAWLEFQLAQSENGVPVVTSRADPQLVTVDQATAVIQAIAADLQNAPFVVRTVSGKDVQKAMSDAQVDKQMKQNEASWK